MSQTWQDVVSIQRYCHCPDSAILVISGLPGFVRVTRRVCDGFITFHHANQQANALLLSRGLVETDRAPDSYAEFLLRAGAASVHEPPAGRR